MNDKQIEQAIDLVLEQDDAYDFLDMPRSSPVPDDLGSISISGIARLIRRDWKKVYFGAVPYLDAMSQLDSIDDKYMFDDGRSVVAYFLANANTWRGPVAKAVKAELKRRLKR